jgi:hypothetical protein
VRTFTIEVPDALTLDWERAPHISQEGIKGSVVVSNQTAHTVDLTVIIVAVNEVGKAFALAEQHFPLPAGMDSSIPFGKNAVLPFGKYTLHADAVGEVDGYIVAPRDESLADAKLVEVTVVEVRPFDRIIKTIGKGHP